MSLKKQLTSLIISSVILAIFFASLHGYRSSLEQLESVFDQELISVANVVHHVVSTTQHLSPQIPSEILFQVIASNRIISASKNAPAEPIKSTPNALDIATFFGQRWRTYTKQENGLTVVVAQPVASGSQSAEGILYVTILPMIIVTPIIGLLIYYIIHTSLGGVLNLSKQLRQKNPHDLTEINTGNVPTELSPVVERLNDLLHRLALAFEREKQLSANAAHELRTPISVLGLTAHNIEQEFKNNTLDQNLIDELKQNIKRQAHVIEQVIALHRFTPEQFHQALKPVSLMSVLQDAISNNYEQIDANGQTIELECNNECVEGDHFALYTLFENIIANSVKYSGNNTHIQVTVETHHSHVHINIEDSGKGISDSETTKVFERFYRTLNHTAQIKGSGLGLSIAKHIVTLHNGDIFCERSALGGLKTQIQLPGIRS